jgi:2-phosphoglycerate kinase
MVGRRKPKANIDQEELDNAESYLPPRIPLAHLKKREEDKRRLQAYMANPDAPIMDPEESLKMKEPKRVNAKLRDYYEMYEKTMDEIRSRKSVLDRMDKDPRVPMYEKDAIHKEINERLEDIQKLNEMIEFEKERTRH